jgi:hypothetical protein
MSKASALAATVILAGIAPLVSAAVTAGCGTLCERNPDEPPVVYKDGITHFAGTPYAWYESAPLKGPYLDFPPGRTYRFVHQLGGVVGQPQANFSFAEFPIATTNDGPHKSGFVTGAGNQATFERATADTFDIRNDTCSDVYLRVTAAFPTLGDSDAGTPTPIAGDAGVP